MNLNFRSYNPERDEMDYFDLDTYDKNHHCQYGNESICIDIADETGISIYTGDIVSALFEYFNGSYHEKEVIGVVEKTEWCTYAIRYFENGEETYLEIADTTHFQEPCIHILGNKWQNPELIEK